jgi:excisionase family DNA binding protein
MSEAAEAQEALPQGQLSEAERAAILTQIRATMGPRRSPLSTGPAVAVSELSGPAYLTAERVADLLQVSAKSVYRWTKDDPTIPALRIGGTVCFHRERLERWLRGREQGTPRMRRQMRAVAQSPTSKEPAGA